MKHITFFLALFFATTQLFANDTIVVGRGRTTADFRTIQEALDAIPSGKTTWTVVVIRPGIYLEKLVLGAGKTNIKIVGDDAHMARIAWNDHAGKIVGSDTLGTSTSYTFQIRGNNIILDNLTIENTAGPVGQGVALDVLGDQIAIYNCRLLGFQDTYYARGQGRTYVKNSYIDGTTDFIFGSGIVLFEDCEIFCKRDSYITAASTPEGHKFGYVFKNCKISGTPLVTAMYLGRPWRDFAKTVFMNCELDLAVIPAGWHNWGKVHAEQTAFYAEYKNTGIGANTSQRVAWSHQLTDEQARQYTIENIFGRNASATPYETAWIPTKR
jgi:pectinesterase